MTTQKSKTATKKTKPTRIQPPSPDHRLNTLLHTMRCIRQYEDALCELSHEMKRTGTLSSEAADALRDILGKIPSHDYVHDLQAVSDMLPTSAPAGS